MMQAQIVTRWSPLQPEQRPMTDEERDAQFTRHVREVAAIKLPWLFPLLDAGLATIYTEPGVFLFALPTAPNTWHAVPELANLITMAPWAEALTQPQ